MDPRRRFFLRGQLSQALAPELPAPPRPPWTPADDAVFTARCTRCGECLQACPRGLLQAGDGGFPTLRFTMQGCDACGACRRACAPGAIAPEAGLPAFRWRIAVQPNCLAQQRVECRVCAELCEAGALRFVPALGGIPQLRIDSAACTGCGECVAPCPVGAIAMRLPAAHATPPPTAAPLPSSRLRT